MGGGVLRPHVQLHGLVVELDQVDGVHLRGDPEQLPAALVLLGGGVAARRAERGQQAHRLAPGISGGLSWAGSAHSRLWVKAIGSPNEA